MAYETRITQKYLKSILDYDPETGIFIWKHRSDASERWNKRYAKSIAGGITGHGHRHISINNKQYLVHRLAWLYMTGEWPERDIDHKNRKKDDNSFANLRLATVAQNQWNTEKRLNNTSGQKGVYWDKNSKKWRVQMSLNGKCLNLGCFDCIEIAALVYSEHEAKFRGEFARRA